jgi:hypothetical protein
MLLYFWQAESEPITKGHVSSSLSNTVNSVALTYENSSSSPMSLEAKKRRIVDDVLAESSSMQHEKRLYITGHASTSKSIFKSIHAIEGTLDGYPFLLQLKEFYDSNFSQSTPLLHIIDQKRGLETTLPLYFISENHKNGIIVHELELYSEDIENYTYHERKGMALPGSERPLGSDILQ